MQKISNKLLLAGLLISYLLIVISVEEWDVFNGIGLFMSLFGIYNFKSLCLPLTGFYGISIVIYFIFKRRNKFYEKNILLLSGVFSMIVPLFIVQNFESIKLEWDRNRLYFIPEIVFFLLYLIVLHRLLLGLFVNEIIKKST